ncbi:hypothetical protein ACW4FQ_31835, partial [Escherichia coli]
LVLSQSVIPLLAGLLGEAAFLNGSNVAVYQSLMTLPFFMNWALSLWWRLVGLADKAIPMAIVIVAQSV